MYDRRSADRAEVAGRAGVDAKELRSPAARAAAPVHGAGAFDEPADRASGPFAWTGSGAPDHAGGGVRGRRQGTAVDFPRCGRRIATRSDERRVGKAGVSTFRSRWSQYHQTPKTIKEY